MDDLASFGIEHLSADDLVFIDEEANHHIRIAVGVIGDSIGIALDFFPCVLSQIKALLGL